MFLKKQKHNLHLLVENRPEIKIKEVPLRSILENYEDRVWAIDKEYRLIFGNSSFLNHIEKYTGHLLEPGEFVFGRGTSQKIIDEWKGYYDRALKGERFKCEIKLKLYPEQLDMNYLFTPIYGKDGEIDGAAIWGRDITEHKRAEMALQGSEKELEKKTRLLAEVEQELQKQEALLEKIFKILPVGLWFADKNGKLLRGNSVGKQIWGMEPLVGQEEYGVFKARRLPSGEEITPEGWALAHTVNKGVTIVDEILEIEAFDGKKKVICNYTAPVLDEQGNIQGAIVVNQDITEQKQAEDALKNSEALKSSIIDCIPDILMRFNDEGRYLDILTRDENLLYLPAKHLLGRTLEEVMPEDLADKFLSCIKKALQIHSLQTLQYSLETPAGKMEFEARVSPSSDKEVVAFIRDITEYKLYENQLKQLSLYDQLTGMYNRNYFDAQLKRFSISGEDPITILTTDLDGLKLINDTLGLSRGDELLRECAGILEQSLRTSDLLARVGGDEFAAILPRTKERAGEKIVSRIRSQVKEYNENNPHLPLSISIGMASVENDSKTLQEAYKEADDNMYRDKLHKGIGIRAQIIDALMTALGERDFITKGHAERLTELTKKIGEKIGLSSRQVSDLALLSQVHDLGKVGIPDQILFKEGSLTKNEWEVMCQHPEKGYRIAASSKDLFGIADLILKHHEKWDGSGYPLGLAGKEIPVECRILSIVDAFDAMTNDRPYRKAKSIEEAVEELKRCSGTHFEPELVEVFLEVLREGKKEFLLFEGERDYGMGKECE